MKIDEVIEHLEDCISYNGDCSECKMETVCLSFPWRDFDKEALQYLKEYRDFQNGVKCKNCKFYNEDITKNKDIFIFDYDEEEHYCRNIKNWVLKDDYCSRFIERMNDGTTESDI